MKFFINTEFGNLNVFKHLKNPVLKNPVGGGGEFSNGFKMVRAQNLDAYLSK